jgi:hypothetical protein
MAKKISVRIASAVGLSALVAFFVTMDPFLSVGAPSLAPTVSVNRTLKGDRLPLIPEWKRELSTQPKSAPSAQIPFACDSAVSLIRSPKSPPVSAEFYRRCMA